MAPVEHAVDSTTAPPTTPAPPTTTRPGGHRHPHHDHRRPGRGLHHPGRPTGPAALPVPGPVTTVGDSIMLDIQPYLETDIPGASVDGMVSRQFETGIGVVQADRADGTLGHVLVVELGTNGSVTDSDFDAMMQAAAGVQRVVFVNVDVPRAWEAPDNAVLAAGVARYPGSGRAGRLVHAVHGPSRVVHPRPGPPGAGRGTGAGRPHRPERLSRATVADPVNGRPCSREVALLVRAGRGDRAGSPSSSASSVA